MAEAISYLAFAGAVIILCVSFYRKRKWHKARSRNIQNQLAILGRTEIASDVSVFHTTYETREIPVTELEKGQVLLGDGVVASIPYTFQDFDRSEDDDNEEPVDYVCYTIERGEGKYFTTVVTSDSTEIAYVPVDSPVQYRRGGGGS